MLPTLTYESTSALANAVVSPDARRSKHPMPSIRTRPTSATTIGLSGDRSFALAGEPPKTPHPISTAGILTT